MLNFDWLAGVSQETAKLIFYALYILIGILVLLIPNSYIFRGLEPEDRKWYRNLKIWAIFVLATLICVYGFF